jgi:predicted SAM-dependent methyltransferase
LKKTIKKVLRPYVYTPRIWLKQWKVRNLAQASRAPRIVVGASGFFDHGWIPTDIDVLNLLRPRDWGMCFDKNSLEAILAEHVWEHLTVDEGIVAARHCYQYLKPGGYFRVAVPDGLHPDAAYIEYVRPGGIGSGADDHKVLYTYQTLREVLVQAGFDEIELLEYFDESGQFNDTAWRPEDGMIRRSKRFDKRNADGSLSYTSLIIDAKKKKRHNHI